MKPERKLWFGCNMRAWLTILSRHRFDVSPCYAGAAAATTAMSLWNGYLRTVEHAVFGARIARTDLVGPPIFVIGHWRTGTTLLHELLSADPRHSSPNTYQCFLPNHFLLTEEKTKRRLACPLRENRLIDKMLTTWDSPQEDEFAILASGKPSFYSTIAFPNHTSLYREHLDIEALPADARLAWRRCLMTFLRKVTFRTGKRLILKSPTHTMRIRTLLDMFPDAAFVHIVRNPYEVFQSTFRLWQTLFTSQGFQKPTFEGLEEHVFGCFLAMHDRLEATRSLVASSRFCETRYERLIADPIGEIEAVYDRLGLGEFDRVRPILERDCAARADYRPTSYNLPPELVREIDARWGPVIDRYGYLPPQP